MNFLLVNCQSLADAAAFHSQLSLGDLPHGHGPVPGQYCVRYIPHKVLIGKDGRILKNYEGFQVEDIEAAMAADEPGGGPVSGMTEEEEVAHAVAKVFSAYDENGDGLISFSEFSTLLQGLSSRRWTESKVTRLMRKVDTNGDGMLDYAELCAWLCAADSGKVRRALGLASVGADGGLPHCAKMCGRPPFRHHATCCPRCTGPDSRHSNDCNRRCGPKCANGCGRRPYKAFTTCCTHCDGSAGPHSRDCDERCKPSCAHGCGRKACGDYPTCCIRCGGTHGPHSRGCRAPRSPRHGSPRHGGGHSGSPRHGGSDHHDDVPEDPVEEPADEPKDVGLTEVLGDQLLCPDGSKISTAAALSGCALVGILFTATW